MQYPAAPQTLSRPHTASDPQRQPWASRIVGSPQTYPAPHVHAPSLHRFGAHPCSSLSVRCSAQARSSAQTKPSPAQLAALHPCWSTPLAPGSQTRAGAHSKPSSQGLGSQCPVLPQRSPSLQESLVQAGPQSVGVPEVHAGAGCARQTVPMAQSVSALQRRMAIMLNPQPGATGAGEQKEPCEQSAPLRHLCGGSASFFLQLGSMEPASPPSPLEPAPVPEEPPVPAVPPCAPCPLPDDPPAPSRAPLLPALPPLAEPLDPPAPAMSRPALPDWPLAPEAPPDPAPRSSGPSSVEWLLEQARPAAVPRAKSTQERARTHVTRRNMPTGPAMIVPGFLAQAGTRCRRLRDGSHPAGCCVSSPGGALVLRPSFSATHSRADEPTCQ